jgi:hypothetical protein
MFADSDVGEKSPFHPIIHCARADFKLFSHFLPAGPSLNCGWRLIVIFQSGQFIGLPFCCDLPWSVRSFTPKLRPNGTCRKGQQEQAARDDRSRFKDGNGTGEKFYRRSQECERTV